MDLGKQIKSIRQDRGLSQEELARAIGATKSAVSRYEAGKREPNLEQLQAIAAALDVQVVDLLGPYEGPPLPGLADGDKLDDGETVEIPISFKAYATLHGKVRARISAALDQLNEEGREKAAERVEELTEIPRYQATAAPQLTPAPQEGVRTTDTPDAQESGTANE